MIVFFDPGKLVLFILGIIGIIALIAFSGLYTLLKIISPFLGWGIFIISIVIAVYILSENFEPTFIIGEIGQIILVVLYLNSVYHLVDVAFLAPAYEGIYEAIPSDLSLFFDVLLNIVVNTILLVGITYALNESCFICSYSLVGTITLVVIWILVLYGFGYFNLEHWLSPTEFINNFVFFGNPILN